MSMQDLQHTQDTQDHARRRQAAITELQRLRMFDIFMAMDTWPKLVGIGRNPGALYLATYRQFQMEIADCAKAQDMDKELGVMLGLLSVYDLYGLEKLIQDVKEDGVALVYARLLGSAIQTATGIGDAIEHLSAVGRGAWKDVYLTLKFTGWTPDIPMKTKTPDALEEVQG